MFVSVADVLVLVGFAAFVGVCVLYVLLVDRMVTPR